VICLDRSKAVEQVIAAVIVDHAVGEVDVHGRPR
jgi:hypothetical protein